MASNNSIYYLTASVGQESRHNFAKSSGSGSFTGCNQVVSQGCSHLKVPLRKDALPASLGQLSAGFSFFSGYCILGLSSCLSRGLFIFLPCGALHQRAHNRAACFITASKQKREGGRETERKTETEVTVFYTLISEVYPKTSVIVYALEESH